MLLTKEQVRAKLESMPPKYYPNLIESYQMNKEAKIDFMMQIVQKKKLETPDQLGMVLATLESDIATTL